MATTRVYRDYDAFLEREDLEGNGISIKALMERYGGDMERAIADNATNEGCWDCRGCTDCNSSDLLRDCRACWDSSHCTESRHLHDCEDCHGCNSCEGQRGLWNAFGISDGEDEEEDEEEGEEEDEEEAA